jgi:phosphate transport system permease protein
MNTIPETPHTIASALNSPAVARRRQWRMFKDKVVKHAMTVGGISVIIAILLIFFYLLYVVFPLLLPASITTGSRFATPAADAGKTLYLATEEKNELAIRVTDSGHVIFFTLKDGNVLDNITLPIPQGVTISALGISEPATGIVAVGLSNGQALILKHEYTVSYPNGKQQRQIKPSLSYPLGEQPVIVDPLAQPIVAIDVQIAGEQSTLAAITADHHVVLVNVHKQESLLDDTATLEQTQVTLPLQNGELDYILLSKDQHSLYVANKAGEVVSFNIIDKAAPSLISRVRVIPTEQHITAIDFLTGDISLLIADSSGRVSQWFPVRNAEGAEVLTKIREFYQGSDAVTHLAPEERRKGFATVNHAGQLTLFHSTAHRTLLTRSIGAVTALVLSPRADLLVAESEDGQMHTWRIHNEHPEVSWTVLWDKVWYESYEKPEYIWQSSSASSDFEPKFSLIPLVFGTFKAAFYAMLISIPIAILGAIYTAYFMAGAIRGWIKPTIEIMQALPTVVLGFIAGLWLAPVIEMNLPGVFALLLIAPFAVIFTAYLWRFVPKSVKYMIPDGLEAILLLPTILFISWGCFAMSPLLEEWLFQGDMRHWLNNIGLPFDQRNSLVVGIAMGIAVIPSIFSITEDAIFSVPKHLTSGSLALGATPWQTMTRVVILTASPGIFSAIMIGLGRAVGETMIVLMATGNTAVMDLSIFQGLRTLSANIAVEMPESEVASTHYRILFLSALVLFMLTFFFNTVAEIVRHRLRRKYSSL